MELEPDNKTRELKYLLNLTIYIFKLDNKYYIIILYIHHATKKLKK